MKENNEKKNSTKTNTTKKKTNKNSKSSTKTSTKKVSQNVSTKKGNTKKIVQPEIKKDEVSLNVVKEIRDKKKISSIFYILFFILYIEMITKIFVFKSGAYFFNTILFSIPFIILFYFICNIFKEKGNKIIGYILTFIITFYYAFQCVFYRLFSLLFSFNSISMAHNAVDFKDMAFSAAFNNLPIIILYFVPFILLIIFRKRINFKRTNKMNLISLLGLLLIAYGVSILSLNINKEDVYSRYNLYYNINDEYKTTQKFGMATYTSIDIKRVLFGFDEAIIQTNINAPKVIRNVEHQEEVITYNQIDIDFDSLIQNESNTTIQNILTYFKNSSPTNQSKYTGMFKGKNLIFILAEGFNMIAVDKELTPTLYKLTHEGFVFNNYYSPVFLSTTGGEFQATTGMIPTQETLSLWKRNMPTIQYALGNSFKNIGYHTQSYHDWTYTYYTRQNTMPTLGFDSYMGCGNGLEKLISCRWLPSDVDMMNVTLPMYQDYEHFMTYYVSVSGHAPYEYQSTGNSIALKNTEYVKDLPYSAHVKAYLATQIEFDRALETLIKKLDEAGILQDTVISFVGDHYPYTLTVDEVNELSTYTRDDIVEVNRSNFVIWNSEMEHSIEIDKVGSQIDVLPTLLNLFGIEYDSRLIIGNDILSDTPGMAIFSNRSWVSDYGTYRNGRFTLKDGKVLENVDEYIKAMNTEVATRFTLSNQIIKYSMYEYILK